MLKPRGEKTCHPRYMDAEKKSVKNEDGAATPEAVCQFLKKS